MDSAVKGTALLMLAAVAVVILKRDSAATRHLVWLLAMVAMLVVPVLSAMLPEWRVLPGWAEHFAAERLSWKPARPRSPGRRIVPVELPRNAERVEIERPAATAYQPAAELPRFTARVGGPGSHCRAGRFALELVECIAACVGDWFFRAHPAADGRSMDALEYRATRDGSLVVRATCEGKS